MKQLREQPLPTDGFGLHLSRQHLTTFTLNSSSVLRTKENGCGKRPCATVCEEYAVLNIYLVCVFPTADRNPIPAPSAPAFFSGKPQPSPSSTADLCSATGAKQESRTELQVSVAVLQTVRWHGNAPLAPHFAVKLANAAVETLCSFVPAFCSSGGLKRRLRCFTTQRRSMVGRTCTEASVCGRAVNLSLGRDCPSSHIYRWGPWPCVGNILKF